MYLLHKPMVVLALILAWPLGVRGASADDSAQSSSSVGEADVGAESSIEVSSTEEQSLESSMVSSASEQSSSSGPIEDSRTPFERNIEDLSSPNASVRANAASALGRMGPEAGPAAFALSKLLRDEVVMVRIFAAKALRRIGPSAREAIAELVPALQDEHYEFSVFVKSALLSIVTSETDEALPLLLALLRTENSQVVDAAEEVLEKMGTAEAVEAVRKSREHRASPVVKQLLEELQDYRHHVRRNAIQELGDLGPDAKAAVPSLIEFLRVGRTDLRMWAEWALEQIGPDAVPELLRAIRGTDVVLQKGAARVLRKIDTPEANSAWKEYQDSPASRY